MRGPGSGARLPRVAADEVAEVTGELAASSGVAATCGERYLGRANELFDQNGRLTSESTRNFLRQFLRAFESWIETVAPRRVATSAAR